MHFSAFLESEYRLLTLSSQNPEDAARDFRNRIKNYEKVYETIDESERHYTYIKITNIGYVLSDCRRLDLHRLTVKGIKL